MIVTIVHIRKESANLDESELLGVDSNGYEMYEDLENQDSKFRHIAKDVLKLNPKDVKPFGISKQTLWNVKEKIRLNMIDKISMRIKVKILTVVAHEISLKKTCVTS